MSEYDGRDKGQESSCPACGSEIRFKKQPWRGELITCPDCESLLEVTRTSPVELSWAFEDPLYDARERFRRHERQGDGRDKDWEFEEDDGYADAYGA